MSGVKDLNYLLSNMQPQMQKEEYVFCSIKNAKYADYAEVNPLASFIEQEGLTLVVTKQEADTAKFKYVSVLKCITLTVHSSLEAVGLTAAVSTKLAEYGISANVIAAYYHDHVFVPADKAEMAMIALGELSEM